MFVSAGGEIKDEHQVTEIIPGPVVTVRTNKGSFTTKRLIVTAGPWTNKVLKSVDVELPLKVSEAWLNGCKLLSSCNLHKHAMLPSVGYQYRIKLG